MLLATAVAYAKELLQITDAVDIKCKPEALTRGVLTWRNRRSEAGIDAP